jgi:cytochrome c-type biogenesis protein CcmE
VGVALVVTYLMWTGVRESMLYYITPAELMAQVDEDPSLRERGLQVSGWLVPNTYERSQGTTHRFTVSDKDKTEITFPVEYVGTVPDTFRPNEPDVEVVMKGRLREDGVFVATEVITKCGSRYEAADEVLTG